MLTRLTAFFILLFTVVNAQQYTLETLCKKGIENNSNIKSFAYKTSASNSYYKQSVDQYKPHFNISGQLAQQNYTLSYSYGDEKYHGLSHQYQFSLNQPVYRPTLLYAMDDAKKRILLAHLMEEDEKAKLITRILQNTFELIRLKKNVQILTQKSKLLEKAYKNLQEKHALKLASKVDVYQSLSMLKQSHSDLAIAKQTYHQLLFNLRMLTKIENVEKYIENLDFNMPAVKKAFGKLNIRSVKSQYIHNTRVKLEEQTAKIAQGQIDMRNSERYPQVDAVFSYGDSGGTIDTTVRQNDSRAMLTLNFPIYQGGYVDDRVEEARYLALSAKSTAEDLMINIKISLEKSIQDIRSGIESFNADTVAVQASKKYFDATITSYKNGMGSLTDAYLAEADYHDNRLRLVNTQSNIFSSLAEIYYYSGLANFKYIKKLQKKYLR
jgi:outer membrane protein